MASWSLFSKFVFCSILMTWNFTVDGSTKMPNGHMDAIEPYDYRAFVKLFHESYGILIDLRLGFHTCGIKITIGSA